MKGRAIFMLFFALVAAGGAVWLARGWLDSQVKTIVVTEEAKAPIATVVVANELMPFGRRITANYLEEIPWPAGNIPVGAFSTIEELTNENDVRVVLQTIQQNEPVLKTKISDPGGRATLSAVIDETMRAVTIRVNDVFGVAGFVLPSDRVDILLTRKINDQPTTNILIQNVRVLAIDQTSSSDKDNPKVAEAVTLEVSPAQAQKLALSASVGTLSLALRNRSNTDLSTSRAVQLGDLSAGEGNDTEAAGSLKAVAPAAVVSTSSKTKSVRPRKDDLANIRIVRALDPETVKVIEEKDSSSNDVISITPGVPKALTPYTATPVKPLSENSTSPSATPEKRI
ncbi:Flp pilus assembly protein CpaB [uncultured Sneathiella sp.]|uniref:Flp pilus assembly protein CpaB n=1 Tax=uncultured Sneathiella sp. TaxID=879315 RepID=UPI002594A566|nr:Flp pilus assembly protein CpaB [uncultured Sneathiella sp.]